MSVLVSEHDIVEFDLSQYEHSISEIDLEGTDRLFPNVLSVMPIVIMLEATLLSAGIAAYHMGMSLVLRLHLVH